MHLIELHYYEYGVKHSIFVDASRITSFEYAPWNASSVVYLDSGSEIYVQDWPAEIAAKIKAAFSTKHGKEVA